MTKLALILFSTYVAFVAITLLTKNFGGRGFLPFLKLIGDTVVTLLVAVVTSVAIAVKYLAVEIYTLHKQMLFGAHSTVDAPPKH